MSDGMRALLFFWVSIALICFYAWLMTIWPVPMVILFVALVFIGASVAIYTVGNL